MMANLHCKALENATPTRMPSSNDNQVFHFLYNYGARLDPDLAEQP